MSVWPIAALAASALAACGGSSGQAADENAVKDAVGRWSTAVVHQDGRAACAELTARLRKQIERHLLGEGVAGGCNEWADKWVSPRHPAAHRRARITAVQIHGDRATVSLTSPGAAGADASLVHQNGRWRIDDY
jgi:hypothetical protein